MYQRSMLRRYKNISLFFSIAFFFSVFKYQPTLWEPAERGGLIRALTSPVKFYFQKKCGRVFAARIAAAKGRIADGDRPNSRAAKFCGSKPNALRIGQRPIARPQSNVGALHATHPQRPYRRWRQADQNRKILRLKASYTNAFHFNYLYLCPE